jgi:uncharacterized protein
MVGALIGTTVLTNVDGDSLRPILAAMLAIMGLRILWRFSSALPSAPAGGRDVGDVPGIEIAGVAGGTANGMIGAWGPVVTPFLLHRGVPPRLVVGSVNTAEVAVAVVAAGSLLADGGNGLGVGTVIAMLIGGIVASPAAAWTVRYVPARILGVLVAGLLLATNARELAAWTGLGSSSWIAYGAIAALTVAGAARPRLAGSSSGGDHALAMATDGA